MTLLELLVKELPKRGGWPDENYKFGNFALVQGHQGAIYRAGGGDFLCTLEKADDWEVAEVSRVQYESALAASQKVEWDGVGLPPVGAECQIILTAIGYDGDLGECEILFVGDKILVWRQKSTFAEGSCLHRHVKFLLTNSEADRIRREAIAALKQLKPQLVGNLAGYLYDEIAAGKIPGVRIE